MDLLSFSKKIAIRFNNDVQKESFYKIENEIYSSFY